MGASPPPVQMPERSTVPSASLGAGRFTSAAFFGPFSPPRRRGRSCACGCATNGAVSPRTAIAAITILFTGASPSLVAKLRNEEFLAVGSFERRHDGAFCDRATGEAFDRHLRAHR